MPNTDTQINQRLFERIERKKQMLDDRRPLSTDMVKRLHNDMRVFHTYHSDAIEGNTLSLQETRLVIEEGITIGGKSLREHLEAVGNAEAFDLICELADRGQALDHVIIQRIHEIVCRGQIREPGKYRTENVRIAGAVKSPPACEKIVGLLDDYLQKIHTMKDHPLKVAGFIYHRFVEIHPFIDGNGRVARLLTNLYLIGKGYPPMVLKKEERKKYYTSLRDADNGNLGPFINFIAKAMDESLTYYLSIFGGKDELQPLGDLVSNSPYTQEYLSLRARQGILDAVKIGNVWHSTIRALEEYAEVHGKSKRDKDGLEPQE